MVRVACNLCNATFAQKSSLMRHVRRLHSGQPPVLDCQVCGLIFRNRQQFLLHYRNHARNSTFHVSRNAFRGVAKTLSKYHEDKDNLSVLFNEIRMEVIEVIQNEQNFGTEIKMSIVMMIQCVQLDPLGEIVDMDTMPFRSSFYEITRYEDLEPVIDSSFSQIERTFDEFLRNGSNWVMDTILETRLEFAQCGSLNGMCGLLTPITYFKDIKNVRTKIQRNNDTIGDCFYLCIAYHFTKCKKIEKLRDFISKRITKIKSQDSWNSMDVKKIQHFLKKNQSLDLRINVIFQDEKSLYPILSTKNLGASNTINLILHKLVKKDRLYYHYSYVEDLNKLLRKSYSDSTNITYEKTFPCPNCLHKFSSSWTLKEHEKDCLKTDTKKLLFFPEEKIQFDKFLSQFPIPFIGFFDFEATCENIKPEEQCKLCKEPKCIHNTRVESNQVPCGYSYVIIFRDGTIVANNSYLGEDPVNHFITSLIKDYETKIKPKFQAYPNPFLTEEEEEEFQSSEICHICKGSLRDESLFGMFDRVRDHCHIEGTYYGAAHQACNLSRKDKKHIPMFCHNFSGYDSHLIMKHLNPSKLPKINDKEICIKGLPYNTEKVRTLEIGKFRFLDSLGFLQASLSELTKNLQESKGKFNILKKMKLAKSSEQKQLLLRKGIINSSCY